MLIPLGVFLLTRMCDDELAQLSIGLLIGAFVHVKSSEADIPVSVLGSRIRFPICWRPLIVYCSEIIAN